MINNIDVTLRDGGYQNNFHFPLDYAVKHVQALSQSGVEWMEIGYRNGSFKPMPDMGITGHSPDSYIKAIHDAVPEAKIVVIAHPHNITENDVVNMKNNGVSLLRLCIKTDNPQPALALCEIAKSIGLTVSVNITRVSQITVSQLLDVAMLCQSAGTDIIYLADSNGSLLPDQVARLVHVLKGATNMEVGFHAHDNLGLAMANSIEALKAGATFIDGSLTGMGKGSGNLVLETWLSLLNSYQKKSVYDTERVLNQVNMLQSHDFFTASKRSLVDTILGMKNLSVEYKNVIEKSLQQNCHFVFNVIDQLVEEKAA